MTDPFVMKHALKRFITPFLTFWWCSPRWTHPDKSLARLNDHSERTKYHRDHDRFVGPFSRPTSSTGRSRRVKPASESTAHSTAFSQECCLLFLRKIKERGRKFGFFRLQWHPAGVVIGVNKPAEASATGISICKFSLRTRSPPPQ